MTGLDGALLFFFLCAKGNTLEFQTMPPAYKVYKAGDRVTPYTLGEELGERLTGVRRDACRRSNC